MRRIFDIIERVAREDSTILIEGESGTGKELVARAIHRKSLRVEKPFIKVNCGALNDNLLESELFGHEKGAFTGAIRQRKGRFELADAGTLFLDEVGDISLAMQVKLLRVLQEKEYERVGGEETLHSDVRLVAATNRDLSLLVKEDKFRDDLYYRLRVIPIQLPPLRDRREDVPILVDHFLKKMADNRHAPAKQLDSGAMDLLQSYRWPGNIRELENLVERLCVISPGEIIETSLVALHLTEPRHQPLTEGDSVPLEDAVLAFEKRLILEALKAAHGVKNQAAKALGIKTSTLYSKMERLGIPQ
jgi:transcriptional regulator with GAF, ATPase, and Fis domain